MKRINFDLVRAEEELAGARQCIVCLCGATLTSSGAAILFKFDAMPTWGMVVASIMLLFFLLVGTLYAFLPTLRENRYHADPPAHRHRHRCPLETSPCEDPE